MNFRHKAIVFDFDGVLVDSVDVKTQAFEHLYESYGEAVKRAVMDYHLAHGGISRNEKFRYFHRVFLRRELSQDEELYLARRFSVLVEDAVVAAPWVAGAHEFLEAYCARLPLFIASGTPEDELKRIVRKRGMAGYFCDVKGAPAPKSKLLTGFATELGTPRSELLMIGDSMTDYDAASDVGASFIGRVPPGLASPFPAEVLTMPDLSMLAECV